MFKVLTPALLELLRQLGYISFLSRTTEICGADADMCITLTPVKYKPDLNTLPELYDTYFDINEESVQLALGIDEALIIVDLRGVKPAYPVPVLYAL